MNELQELVAKFMHIVDMRTFRKKQQEKVVAASDNKKDLKKLIDGKNKEASSGRRTFLRGQSFISTLLLKHQGQKS